MPSKTEFEQRRPTFTLNLSGHFGSGKTLQAHSFPKCYTISVDPAGLETLRQPRNRAFLDNLVWFEELNTEKDIELKQLFNLNATADQCDSLFGCLAHAKQLAAAGEVETLVIDGFSFLCDLKWQQICRFEEVKSERTGNLDTQAMYRALGLQLYRLVATDIMTLATRHNLSVIFTTHLKRESEEAVQGNANLKNRARKVVLNSDLAPMIEGGFRNKFEGLVGASLYLEKKLDGGSLKYTAICDTTTAMGTVVCAKNRFGLPTRLDLMSRTLYQAVSESLNGKAQASTSPTPTKATVAK